MVSLNLLKMSQNSTSHILTVVLVHVIITVCVLNITVEADTGVPHLTSLAGISLEDCFKECKDRVSCQSFTYRRRATYCKLYDQTIPDYRLGTRTPGLVYRDLDGWPELGQPFPCNGKTCTVGEKCEDACKTIECPIPSTAEESQILGNLRNIGSKIEYRCTNLFTEPVQSLCKEGGSWSISNDVCNTYRYVLSGPNTYQQEFGDADSRRFTLETTSLGECLRKCNHSISCFGVNFYRENETCVSTNVHSNTRMSTIQGWYHYSKNWPVSLYFKNYKSYEFTYEEGAAYCTAIGSTVASESDLRMANGLGYSYCVCGWVNSRKAMLSIDSTANCQGFHPGVSDCWLATKFDVFCKNTLFTS